MTFIRIQYKHIPAYVQTDILWWYCMCRLGTASRSWSQRVPHYTFTWMWAVLKACEVYLAMNGFQQGAPIISETGTFNSRAICSAPSNHALGFEWCSCHIVLHMDNNTIVLSSFRNKLECPSNECADIDHHASSAARFFLFLIMVSSDNQLSDTSSWFEYVHLFQSPINAEETLSNTPPAAWYQTYAHLSPELHFFLMAQTTSWPDWHIGQDKNLFQTSLPSTHNSETWMALYSWPPR